MGLTPSVCCYQFPNTIPSRSRNGRVSGRVRDLYHAPSSKDPGPCASPSVGATAGNAVWGQLSKCDDRRSVWPRQYLRLPSCRRRPAPRQRATHSMRVAWVPASAWMTSILATSHHDLHRRALARLAASISRLQRAPIPRVNIPAAFASRVARRHGWERGHGLVVLTAPPSARRRGRSRQFQVLLRRSVSSPPPPPLTSPRTSQAGADARC